MLPADQAAVKFSHSIDNSILYATTAEAGILVILLDTELLMGDFFDLRCYHDLSYTTSSIRRLVTFISAYLATNSLNKVANIAMSCDGCHHVYETPLEKDTDTLCDEAGHRKVCQEIMGRLLIIASRLLQDKLQNPEGSDVANSFLPAGISMAVCLCRRLAAGEVSSNSLRILCLRRSSRNLLRQYVSTTNAIFSAKRSGIPIDSFVYGNHDSAVLQQAAIITSGTYCRTREHQKIGQYLMSMFCLELSSRGSLLLTRENVVDLVASCFCHRKSIDCGYVCSTCVSIFCAAKVTCPTCVARSSDPNRSN